MPKSIRVDNGSPLGDPNRKTIPKLALWLQSKQIEVIFNRPRKPTDNAKVERMQRTTKNWAELSTVQNIADLEARLKHVCWIQREVFKVSRLGYQTRLQRFAELKSNPRRYDPKQFDLQRAYQKLAESTFIRKVGKTGQITLYYQRYFVGRKYTRASISIHFDPQQRSWKLFNQNGQFIRSFLAVGLQPDDIILLTEK